MKKIFTSLFAFHAMNSIAQSSITNTSPIGYVGQIMIASTASAATLPIATIGSGLTWDCSNLVQETGTPTINFTVSTPAGTTYANDYPNSNWHFTDPELVAAIVNSYHSLTADSFVFWVNRKLSSSYEIYDDPELDLVFPFAFNQSVTNSYSKTNYTSAGGISSYQTGSITLTYEGNGTLNLPGGTYPDVAKVKSVRTNSLGPTTTLYMWYNTSNGERLLTYDGVSGNQVIFRSGAPLSIKSSIVEKPTLNYFINPNCKFTLNSDAKIQQFNLTTMNSQIIFNEKHCNSYSFEIPKIASGLYILSVKTDKGILNEKVSIQ
jgi:hypothetical protein